MAWADFDNDGWVDLYVGHELSPSQLFRNKGDGTFEDVTERAGVGSVSFTKGVVAGDYDNDGWPDLYVSNIFADNILYHNNGDGTFTDVAAKLGVQKPLVSFPTWFFDYDNDGCLDILVVSYPASVEEFVKYYLKIPPKAETADALPQQGRRHVRGRHRARPTSSASCRRWARTSATSTTTASSTCTSAPARRRSAR